MRGGTPIEREGVLATLSDLQRRALSGEGLVVLVHGEAGIGKTTVVREFVERRDPRMRILAGACDSMSTPRPLGPFADIAEVAGNVVAAALLGLAPVAELFALTLGAIGRVPSLVVIEDIHWADAATLDLLRFLARRVRAVPVLLVVTYRDDEIGVDDPLTGFLGDLVSASTVRLRLEPLTRDGVRHLAAERGRPDADRLYEATGGNPFFVTEALEASPDVIPETVSDAVRGRLARLSPQARGLAQAVAVVGSPAPVELLRSVATTSELAAADEAVDRGLLVAEERALAFRHELARMVVLDSASALRRADLHSRALSALRAGPFTLASLARIVFHAEAAGDAAAIAEYAPAAAAEAARLGAHREAAAHFGLALEHSVALPDTERLFLLRGQSDACYYAGHMGDAIAAREAAIALRRRLSDAAGEAEDLGLLAYMLWTDGRATAAIAAAVRACDLLRPAGPSASLAYALVHLTQLRAYGLRPADALPVAAQAAAVARRVECPELAFEAEYHAAGARVLMGEDAWDALEDALLLAVNQGLVRHAGRIAVLLAALGTYCGELPRSLEVADWGISYAAEHDLHVFVAVLRGWRAMALLESGKWDAACAEAAEIAASRRTAWAGRCWAILATSLTRARRGDPRGPALLDEVFAGVDENEAALAYMWAARAEMAWLAGDLVATREHAERAYQLAKDTGPWPRGRAMLYLHRGGAPVPAGMCVAEPYAREIAGDWRGAAEAWDARGYPYEAALARLAGDATAVARALARLDSLGAVPAVALARRRLRELGVRRHTRGPRTQTRENVYNLTHREIEVAGLLVAGMTDADIAASLCISVRTVSTHVSAVLTKLGVRNRREAGLVIGESGAAARDVRALGIADASRFRRSVS